MKKVALLLPVLSGILWGSAGIFVRNLQDAGFDSCTVISLKMMLASLLLFGVTVVFRRDLLKIRIKDFWIFLGAGIFGMLLLNFGYNAAVDRLTLSLAAVLLSLSPVFVMVFAAVLFGERITGKKIFCTVLAVAGCILVSGVLENRSEIRISLSGILFGAGAAVFYALYSIFSKLAMERGYGVITVIFYSTLLISAVMLPFTDWKGIGNFVAAAPGPNTLFLLAYAMGTAILPYVLYTAAMAYADAGKVAILGAGGEPSAAMMFGWIFFGERPSLLSVTGLLLTITALTFICLPETNEGK